MTRETPRTHELREPWRSAAWHAAVWAALLAEIPRAVERANADARRALEARIDTEATYWPGSPEEALLRQQLAAAPVLAAELAAAPTPGTCTVASVHRVAEWPAPEPRVSFALRCDGEVTIRCEHTASKLPAVLLGGFGRAPADEAKRLVGAAIRLVSA